MLLGLQVGRTLGRHLLVGEWQALVVLLNVSLVSGIGGGLVVLWGLCLLLTLLLILLFKMLLCFVQLLLVDACVLLLLLRRCRHCLLCSSRHA